MEFKNKPPEWLVEGTEPPEELRQKNGWLAGYKPPASYFNWFWNLCYLCLTELQEKLTSLETSHNQDVETINTELDKKAPLESPVLTGTPTAPTANEGTNTKQIATTGFVATAISTLQNALQKAIDNLETKHGQDISSINTELGKKAPLDSPALTGTPTAPTAVSGTATDQIATTKFVNDIVGNIDFSAFQEHTKYVTNANLNELLEDGNYISAGTMTNTPVATTYCIVTVIDTDSTNRIVQICYVPQTDNSCRTFVRIVNGTTYGAWIELATKSYVDDSLGNIEVPVTSVNGETGDVVIEDYVTGLTVSGKTITYTKKDGTSGKITTQDTNTAYMPNYASYVTISKGDYTPTSNGIIIVKHSHSEDYQTIKIVHKSSGVEIARLYQARYPGDGTIWCPVVKNETYTITVSGGTGTVYFCSMKAV